MKCDFAGDVVEGEIVCGNDVDSEDGFHSEEVDENDESNKTPYKFDDQDERKCGFRNLHFMQNCAVKLCSRILHKCIKMLCFAGCGKSSAECVLEVF